ncbi:MAG: CAP domain-containing protein [Candidatus Pacebacteria bacterium]|nr:CAP domain-containing protein [Candidatus Paceibacterota bacterium]
MKQFLERVFVPGRHNDYTPDILQRTALFLMAFLVVLTFTASNFYALLWQQSDWLVGAVLPAVVVDKTNSERDTLSLTPLVRSAVLDEAARLKAEDMAKNSYFAHYSPTGVSPWHWFAEVNYAYVHAGENLAVHFTDSKEVVEAWMQSPSHRANIVNNNYREIGVGTARGRFEGYDTVFVVQLFGTPALVAAETPTIPAPRTVSPEPVPPTSVVAATEIDPVETVAGAEVLIVEAVPPVDSGDKVETELDTADLVAVDADMPSVTEEAPQFVIADTTMTDYGVALISETITTSTDREPAPMPEMDPQTAPVAAPMTSPSTMMWWIYSIIGGIAMLALGLSVCLEWRQQRLRQVLYGVGLLLLMSLLFWVHTAVISGVTIL